MGTGETEEDVSHLFEQRTALLIGEDGVLEVRLLLVVYNLLDVGTLLPDSRFDDWQVIALLNLAAKPRVRKVLLSFIMFLCLFEILLQR